MSADRTATGRRAEALIASHLEEQGYAILGRNVRVGRLELDVIARRGDLVVVCEVRSRRTDAWVMPAETVDQRKIARIRRATARWLSEQRLGGVDVRFDVASVVLEDPPRVEYYEDAF